MTAALIADRSASHGVSQGTPQPEPGLRGSPAWQRLTAVRVRLSVEPAWPTLRFAGPHWQARSHTRAPNLLASVRISAWSQRDGRPGTGQ